MCRLITRNIEDFGLVQQAAESFRELIAVLVGTAVFVVFGQVIAKQLHARLLRLPGAIDSARTDAEFVATFVASYYAPVSVIWSEYFGLTSLDRDRIEGRKRFLVGFVVHGNSFRRLLPVMIRRHSTGRMPRI